MLDSLTVFVGFHSGEVFSRNLLLRKISIGCCCMHRNDLKICRRTMVILALASRFCWMSCPCVFFPTRVFIGGHCMHQHQLRIKDAPIVILAFAHCLLVVIACTKRSLKYIGPQLVILASASRYCWLSYRGDVFKEFGSNKRVYW